MLAHQTQVPGPLNGAVVQCAGGGSPLTVLAAQRHLVDAQREDSAKTEDSDWWIVEPKADSSRFRTRSRKLAAAKALQGLKPGGDDANGRGRSYTVCICGKFSRNDKSGDLIIEATANSKTSVKNAQFCASSWTCADCAMHIGVTRAAYVERAIDALREAGFRVVMTTMTVPHKLWDGCGLVFDRLKAAHARLDAHGTYRRMMNDFGYVGRIRVIEVTHGASGWHVHSHELMVFEGPAETTSAFDDNSWAMRMQAKVYPTWDGIIMAVSGQNASEEHGFTVVPVWSSTDYIAKIPEQAKKREAENEARKERGETEKQRWGVQAELTKGHTKQAEKGGRTPWDILDGCAAGVDADIALFRDYAQATWNRTQFETTKALRELLASLDIALGSDLEIVRDDPEFVFADELKPDGDQSNMVVDQVLIDRDNQAVAHLANPMWLENVRHDVERELVLNLPDALRAQGFRLELIEAGYFQHKRTNVDAIQNGFFHPDDDAIEAAHYEPSKWRAIWGG